LVLCDYRGLDCSARLWLSWLWIAPLLFWGTVVQAQETQEPPVWHVPQADLRFRIEKDDAQSMVPSISLLDVMPDKASEAVANWVEKNRWTKPYRVNGKLCLNVLPVLDAKSITYNLHPNVGSFVARGVVMDGADPNTSVRFQVLTDKRAIYLSRRVTPQNPVVEIFVIIPQKSRQLKLQIKSSKNRHLSSVKWVDPGVILKRQYPVASSVRLFAPGYDLETFVPQMVLPSDGSKVPCQVLSAAQGDPMEVFFDSSKRNPSYLVYLVPKSKHQDLDEPWQAQTGLILETRWTTHRLRSSDRLPEFRDTFQNRAEPVGKSLVDDIQQTFPIHWPPHGTLAPAARGGYGLYHYRGFFLASQEGKYHFATVSNWDSYLTIDDTLVVAWPGRHDMRGGTRAQKKGTVTLTSGVHKLEYFNYSPWGKMYALAAWKKPNESFRPMTRTDFTSVGRYAPTAVQVRNEKGSYTPFAWSIVDDFRVEQTGRCFVTMRFRPLAPENTEETYRWTFDDGTVTTGHTVDHVFLGPGLRRAQLEVLADKAVISCVKQDVHVHSLWDRMLTNLNNADAYDQTLQQQPLERVPVNDTINVYRLAEKANKPEWKDRAIKTFKQNLSKLVQDADDTDFLFHFGHVLHTVPHKDYQRAVLLFEMLTQKAGLDKQVQRQAAICQAEILITYQGKAQEALDLINQWQGSGSHDVWTRRAIMAKAEMLLALGKSQEASELVVGLSALGSGGGVKQKIEQAGLLRHARSLVTFSSDPNQWEYARAMIEQIVADDPSQIFAPHVNLVKIDLYLAAGEYEAAYFLAERLMHLQLDDTHRVEILMRKVKACCGLRDLDKARAVYTDLKRDYPFHAVLAQAKQAIIEAFRK